MSAYIALLRAVNVGGTGLSKGVSGRRDEEIAPGAREIYVHYGGGMADSKLKIPAAIAGTARNMNTIAKLAEWAAGGEGS